MLLQVAPMHDSKVSRSQCSNIPESPCIVPIPTLRTVHTRPSTHSARWKPFAALARSWNPMPDGHCQELENALRHQKASDLSRSLRSVPPADPSADPSDRSNHRGSEPGVEPMHFMAKNASKQFKTPRTHEVECDLF